MKIKITELCKHEEGENLRYTVYYIKNARTLFDALRHFDSDNIIFGHDDFEGECESSYIVKVEIVN